MTTSTQQLSYSPNYRIDDLPPVDTLALEHRLLMRDVIRRATPVLALLDARAEPHAELGTLIAFLRTAVLRQASDEEVLLFPHDATAPPFAELSADHVRLHTLTARLEQAYTERCAAQEVRGLVNELLARLQRHLHEEQQILAALADASTEVPSAADLMAGEQTWSIDAGGPVVIALDKLPSDQASELGIERVLRLQHGQTAEIRSADATLLSEICCWLQTFDSAGYGVVRSAFGSEHIVEITAR